MKNDVLGNDSVVTSLYLTGGGFDITIKEYYWEKNIFPSSSMIIA